MSKKTGIVRFNLKWSKQQDPTICCLQFCGICTLKVKQWKKKYRANTDQKKGEVAVLMLDERDCIARIISKNKEEQYTIIKESIHQEDVTILNVYALSKRASKYMQQMLIELRELDKSTIIVGDFNTPLSVIDKQANRKSANI